MIRITTDSTADLGELFENLNIPKIPLLVNIGENSYLDGETITPDEIFKAYEQKKILPKTAARNPNDFKVFFEKALDGYDGIVHFSISSKLSCMYENAIIASNEFNNVLIVDTGLLSTGVGLLTMIGYDLAMQGKSAKEIFNYAESIKTKILGSFMVDTMEFLHKGGRCSGMQRLAATLLRINPTLYLKEGKIEVGEKYSGKLYKNACQYVDVILKKYNNPDLSYLFITHTGASDEIIETIRNRILDVYPFKNVYITIAGATITSHCGKGTFGFFYLNNPN